MHRSVAQGNIRDNAQKTGDLRIPLHSYQEEEVEDLPQAFVCGRSAMLAP